MSRAIHLERHVVARVSWLRAAVLGANDGIVSTGSLIVGVAASQATPAAVLLAGAASLVAGAMSMAAGEYVSVSSQADAEGSDLRREAGELAGQPEFEHQELTDIYIARGVEPSLAGEVATQLMARDALGAHARDELGIAGHAMARPLQAAIASAAMFSAGAIAPLAVVPLAPAERLATLVALVSVLGLIILGVIGAKAGGAPVGRSVIRVTFWGVLAMALTAGVGALMGTAVG